MAEERLKLGKGMKEIPLREEDRKSQCKEYKPDHNGECLNCDEPASEHEQKISDGACDWVFARLMEKARNGDKYQLRELAGNFRLEALDDAYIRVLVAIDENRGDEKVNFLLRDVLKKMLS